MNEVAWPTTFRLGGTGISTVFVEIESDSGSVHALNLEVQSAAEPQPDPKSRKPKSERNTTEFSGTGHDASARRCRRLGTEISMAKTFCFWPCRNEDGHAERQRWRAPFLKAGLE